MQERKTTRLLLAACGIAVFAFANLRPLQASPGYYCYRADKPVRVDGRLDEKAWRDVPWILTRGLADGLPPRYSTKAKMLWDDNYLYVGFEVEEPNVWGVVGKDAGESRQVWHTSPEAAGKFIMCRDSFLKVFLDPDGDGKKYTELHINPLNNVNDWWFKRQPTQRPPFPEKREPADVSAENLHLEWDCAGLKSAVQVHGTLNNPEDTDKGWSVEIAFPWSSLSPFTTGKCPPAPGDVWRAHLGRAHRARADGDRTYWTWPVIGVLDCHQVDRWGSLIFSGDPAALEKATPRKGDTAGQLKWKMVWLWSIKAKDKTDAEVVALAKALGFNAIQARSESMIEECHRVGMQALAALWFAAAPKEYVQAMRPYEQARAARRNDNPTAKNLYQSGGEQLIGGETGGGRPWCLDRPEALEFGKQRIDRIIKAGYDGIAFDSIGYKNYYACFCPVSQKKHEELIKRHPGISPEAAIRKYSEERLIFFYTALAEYARKKKPGITITCHIYPHFAPNPLYGNKLPVDYCGQTVSWFYVPHWPLDKIERYAYEIVQKGARFHPKSQGAPFIGIYTLPASGRHRKSARRVREEIRIVKRAGAKAIQLAELGNILNDPEVARVVSEELGGTWKPGQ